MKAVFSKLVATSKQNQLFGLSRGDALFIGTIFCCIFYIFGYQSHLLGFYADDAGFLNQNPTLSISEMYKSFTGYVTGRNLHILWQYLIYLIAGNGIEDLWKSHLIQTLFVALNATLVYVLLRTIGLQKIACLLASAVYAFYPNHAEVQFWLSSLPMNLISSTFVLGLLITGAYVIREIFLNGAVANSGYLLILVFIFYGLALFTYDQVVPLIVTTTLLIGLVALTSKQSRLAGVILLILTIASFAGLFWWKVLQPAGGPILSNLNWKHIWYTFNFSLSSMFGVYFIEPIKKLYQFSIRFEKIQALAIVGILISVAYYKITFDKYFKQNSNLDFISRLKTWKKIVFKLRFLVLVIAACAIFVLAYLPIYIWYLAPRHNYLPSIAVAIITAIFCNAYLYAIQYFKYRIVRLILITPLFICFGYILYYFIVADLVEKKAWIASYQGRKAMYSELEKAGNFLGVDTLILNKFPVTTPYGSAPLGYQQNSEVVFFTQGRVFIENLVTNKQVSQRGVYAYVQPNEHGWTAFRHARWAQTLDLEFLGLNNNKIEFRKLKPNTENPFYSIADSVEANQGHDPSFAVRKIASKPSRYEVTIPKLFLMSDELGSNDELLTLIPYTIKEGLERPITFINAYGAETIIPIEVPYYRWGGGKFELILKEAMPEPQGFHLYISNHNSVSRLLQSAEVKLSIR